MLVRVSAGLFWLPAGTGSAGGGGGGWVDCGTPVLGINRVLGRWFSLFFFLFSVPPPSPAFSVVSFNGKKLPSYPLSVPIGSQSVSQPVSQSVSFNGSHAHFDAYTRLHGVCLRQLWLADSLSLADVVTTECRLHCTAIRDTRTSLAVKVFVVCRCCKNNKAKEKTKNQGVFSCRDQLCCCCCCCCTVILFCFVLFLLSFRLVYCYFSSFWFFYLGGDRLFTETRAWSRSLRKMCTFVAKKWRLCDWKRNWRENDRSVQLYDSAVIFYFSFWQGCFLVFYFVFTTTTTTSLLVTFSLGSQTFSFAINSPSYDWTDLDHFFFLFLFTFAPLHFSFHYWQCTYFLFSPFFSSFSMYTAQKQNQAPSFATCIERAN